MPQKIPRRRRAGGGGLKLGAYTCGKAGYISDHDLKIAGKLAYVLAGGKCRRALVTEQYLLDLEREAFLS